jgi:16S rRNA (guanine527-N7)-methyltransferase
MELNAENTIYKYFSDFTSEQRAQFDRLGALYKEWNQQINVVSRKDIDAIYLHHILHSLSIACFLPFQPGTKILDLGTGGGLPGIPLAIFFPEVEFLLIDGTAKKIKVASEIIQTLGLKNVTAQHRRSEELKGSFEFVLARAVTRLEGLIPLCLRLISKKHHHFLPNGIITLKGGQLDAEIKEVSKFHEVLQVPISKFYEEEYFEEKYILYIQG